ncbi:hypothetical protein [Natronospora cellulosivora (SeqCode)]
MELLLDSVKKNKERLKEILPFISQARRIGLILFFFALWSILFTVMEVIDGVYIALSVLPIIISLLAFYLGLLNYLRPVPLTFLSAGIFFIILGIYDMMFFLSEFVLLYVVIPEFIVGGICIKEYFEYKDLDISDDDRLVFSNLKERLKSIEVETSNLIKMKIYSFRGTRKWECMIIDNDMIIKGKKSKEMYITDKDNFTIIKSSKRTISSAIKGKISMNDKKYKFIISKKYYKDLMKWLEDGHLTSAIDMDKNENVVKEC